jgi:hypothetical protein
LTSQKDASIVPLRRKRPCPSCGRPSERASYPFCSQRCADADLGRWLGGAYAIPADTLEGENNGD